jgi:hypothetical protein
MHINWQHDQVFTEQMTTFQKVYMYFLDTLGCLTLCSRVKRFNKLKETKKRIDKAQKYLENDFDLKKILKSIKHTYAFMQEVK